MEPTPTIQPPWVKTALARFRAGLAVRRNPRTGFLWITAPNPENPRQPFYILKVTDPPHEPEAGAACPLDRRHVDELARMDLFRMQGSRKSLPARIERMMDEMQERHKKRRADEMDYLSRQAKRALSRNRSWGNWHPKSKIGAV